MSRNRSPRNNYSRNIGTVSSCTMREEDLIPSFLSELSSMRPLRREHRTLIRQIKRAMRKADYYGSDSASFDLNESLFDALNEYCLPYFYFGSHPGDGADYGYWLSEEWEEELDSNDGIKVSDLSEVPVGFSGDVAQVSDHGNVTMYRYTRGRHRELWSLV